MVKGYIDEDLEIKVKISLITKSSKKVDIESLLDTGFTGDICISKKLLGYVKLDYGYTEYYELANGKVEEKEVFIGEIIFDDEKKEALFIITESDDTLLGANLLKTKAVNINYKKGIVKISEAR